MRMFIFTIDGNARKLWTYPVGNKPAPDGAVVVAKWPPELRNRVTNIREITRDDLPKKSGGWLRNAWVDDGEKITVDFQKAKLAFQERIIERKRDVARLLSIRETAGEDVVEEKRKLAAIDGAALANATITVEELKAAWPDMIPK